MNFHYLCFLESLGKGYVHFELLNANILKVHASYPVGLKGHFLDILIIAQNQKVIARAQLIEEAQFDLDLDYIFHLFDVNSNDTPDVTRKKIGQVLKAIELYDFFVDLQPSTNLNLLLQKQALEVKEFLQNFLQHKHRHILGVNVDIFSENVDPTAHSIHVGIQSNNTLNSFSITTTLRINANGTQSLSGGSIRTYNCQKECYDQNPFVSSVSSSLKGIFLLLEQLDAFTELYEWTSQLKSQVQSGIKGIHILDWIQPLTLIAEIKQWDIRLFSHIDKVSKSIRFVMVRSKNAGSNCWRYRCHVRSYDIETEVEYPI